MKSKFYFLFALGTLSALVHCPAQATPAASRAVALHHDAAAAPASLLAASKAPDAKSPSGKVRRNAVLAMLGMAESKKVTPPAKLNWRQHVRQEQLKAKARRESRAHRRHIARDLN